MRLYERSTKYGSRVGSEPRERSSLKEGGRRFKEREAMVVEIEKRD